MTESFKKEQITNKLDAVRKVFELTPELAAVGNEREYAEYLESIFPGSTFNEIVWHNSDAAFKDEGFKPSKPKFITLNSIEGIYNFSTNSDFVKRYGQHAYPAVLNIAHAYEDTSHGEFVDDMDTPLSEALYKIGIREPDSIPFSPQVDSDLKDSDAVINTITGKGYRGVHPKTGEDLGLPAQKIVTVFDNSQIHILGSTKDIAGFRAFVEGSS